MTDAVWELNAEAEYAASDLESTDQGETVFRRFGEKLLQTLQQHQPSIKHGYLAVAGLTRSAFKIVAALPTNSPILAQKIQRALSDKLLGNESAMRYLSADENRMLPGDLSPLESRVAVKLLGNGEFFGMLCLDVDSTEADHLMSELRQSWQAICRCLSEAVFSMRLEALAAPFNFGGVAMDGAVSEDALYEQICRQATLGFAADGAVLRLFDKAGNSLRVCGSWGDIRHNPDELGSPGERICQRVFDDSSHYGTARTISSAKGFGVEMTRADEEALRRAGIGSYMVMGLQSDIVSASLAGKLGTLAIFHYRDHEFSLRDIRLFHSFAERVGDDLALIALMKQQEETNEFVMTQSNASTRAEIISLFAHDLGHKAIHASEKVQTLIDDAKKAIRQKLSSDRIQKPAEEALEACLRVENELSQLKALTKHFDAGESVEFNVGDVFAAVKKDFRSALDRNSMNMEIQTSGNTTLHGPRRVLEQVIFNLIINAIDAQKSTGKNRKNTIHVICKEAQIGARRQIKVQFWDDGPGISWPHFPNPNDIFLLGKTSKKDGQGTGTGLPMSRRLIDIHFRGNLELKDRSKALFDLTLESDP
ncbi:GAF domain-containing sensor histidine kinase [Luteolibacter sp.]|uniref:GAF domain-containing sensor histidine kinase n=1 Tax=Luteolibacter sp. TaxID=1962973 RepID=UPI0032652309